MILGGAMGASLRSVTLPGTPPAVFSPSDLGPQVWFDASSGLTESGGTVTAWIDRQNSVGLSVITAAPQYNATGLNGGPCIVFDGNDALSAAVPANTGTTASIAIVGTITGANADGRLAALVKEDPTPNSGRDYDSSRTSSINRPGATTLGSTRNFVNSGTRTVSVDTPFIAIARWNAAAAKFQVGSSTATDGAAEAGSFDFDRIFMGAGRENNGTTPSYFHEGRISDVIYSSTLWSDGDVANLASWAATNRGA